MSQEVYLRPWLKKKKKKSTLSSLVITASLQTQDYKDTKKVLLANRGKRRSHQKRVDEIDVGKPTRWLHYEASTAIRLRREAQNNLQLLQGGPEKLAARGLGPSAGKNAKKIERIIGGLHDPRPRPSQGVLPEVFACETSQEHGGRLCGLVAYGADLEGRVLRAGRASEALPWGAWPIRLKNHEGQDFYRDPSRDSPQFASHCVAGSEDDIHDQLLRHPRREAAAFAVRNADDHHASTVKRLLPSNELEGGWIDASSPLLPSPPTLTTAAEERLCHERSGEMEQVVTYATGVVSTSGVAPDDVGDDDAEDGSEGDVEGLEGSTTAGRKRKKKLSRLEPGWYGGWVEMDRPTGSKTKRCTFGPWKVGDSANLSAPGDPVSASDSLGPVPATKAASSNAESPSRKRPRDAATNKTVHEQGKGTEGERGSRYRDAVFGCGRGRRGGSEGGFHRQHCATSAAVDSGHNSDENSDYTVWHGWTVSEPAKEAVRRVWARASRRGKDVCNPRFVSSPISSNTMNEKSNREKFAADHSSKASHGNDGSDGEEFDFSFQDPFKTLDEELGEGNESDGGDERVERSPANGTPPPPPSGELPAIREHLDPVLAACLGRECEGIIDAALHVVLGDRLRRSTQRVDEKASDETAQRRMKASATGTDCGNSRGNAPASPSPPQQQKDNWEDVLRAMAECSRAARRTGAGSTLAAAAAAAGVVREKPVAEKPERLTRALSVHGYQGERDENGEYSRATESGSREAMKREGNDGGGRGGEVWGCGDASDGAVVVVKDNLPAMPLNGAVLTRVYNRLLLYLHETRPVFAYRNMKKWM